MINFIQNTVQNGWIKKDKINFKKFYFCDRLKMDGIDLDELAKESELIKNAMHLIN